MTLPFSDDFNRANATTLGAPWNDLFSGLGIGIRGNRAYPVFNTANTLNVAVIDQSEANVDCSVTVTTCPNINGLNQGLVFRAQDVNNYWRAVLDFNNQLVTLQLNQSGFSNVGASPYNRTVTAGDTLRVTAVGTHIAIYHNGVQLDTVTNGTMQTQTKHGIALSVGANVDNTADLDNYAISLVSATSGGVTSGTKMFIPRKDHLSEDDLINILHIQNVFNNHTHDTV